MLTEVGPPNWVTVTLTGTFETPTPSCTWTPMTVGCEIVPPLSPEMLDELVLQAWDPAFSDESRRIEWASVSSTLSKDWNGRFGEHYTKASDVFMRAIVKLKDGETLVFQEPRAAIVLSGLVNGELEVGTVTDVRVETNGFNPSGYTWNTHGKAFKADIDKAIYISNDLLSDQALGSEFTTKYITGSKADVPDTDLGARILDVTVSGDEEKSAQHAFDLVVNEVNQQHAKITFYHVPHEANDDDYGPPAEEITIDGSTYYVCHGFRAHAELNGTAKLHRVRTEPFLDKDEGSIPSESQNYIHYVGPRWVFEFKPDVRGALGTPVVHQSAAKFHFDGTQTPTPSTTQGPTNTPGATATPVTGRSYYNFHNQEDTKGKYQVMGLRTYVQEVLPGMPCDGLPQAVSEDEGVQVIDTGSFAEGNGICVDEKHLDIFIEPRPEDSEIGIPQKNMLHLGTQYQKVVK